MPAGLSAATALARLTLDGNSRLALSHSDAEVVRRLPQLRVLRAQHTATPLRVALHLRLLAPRLDHVWSLDQAFYRWAARRWARGRRQRRAPAGKGRGAERLSHPAPWTCWARRLALRRPDRQWRVLMLGLYDAGVTTAMQHLAVLGPSQTSVPCIGEHRPLRLQHCQGCRARAGAGHRLRAHWPLPALHECAQAGFVLETILRSNVALSGITIDQSFGVRRWAG